MRVLLVEDTEDVASAIAASFVRRGHALDHAPTLERAEDFLAVEAYDLVILDINLPDGSGLSLLKRLRTERRHVPVLMLTARLSVEDRVGALDLGADDYLVKPFDLRELEARARALMRRSSEDRGGRVEVGTLSFDPAARTLTKGGAPVVLARRELTLLEILLLNRGRVMAKDSLFEKLFGFAGEEVGMNAIELYVARLRRKIEGSGVAIRTVRGIGYQLVDDAAP